MSLTLSLMEKSGQLLISGFEGTDLNADIENLIVNRGIGGVILFERNYKNPKQLASLIHGMQGLALSNSGIPLFVSVDQEGGRVCRLKAPFSQLPFQSVLGRAGSEDLAFRFGRALGAELNSIGINIDYAPALDVNTNPANPIIGERAISCQPETTARLGSAIIKGFLEAGVIPVGKHFPGHGDTELDSHLDLPIVCKDSDTLEREELVPFMRAARESLPIIMTAHVVYPAWDKELPATFSKFILSGLLRKRLGFEGLIISDDLEMKALDIFPFNTLAELGIVAGLDLFMVCHDMEKTFALQSQIIQGIENGTFSPKRIDESLERILNLKSTLNPNETPNPSRLEKLAASNVKFIKELAAFS